MTSREIKERLVILLIGLSCALLLAVIVPLVVWGWPIARRVEGTSRGLLDCHRNPNCLESQIKAIGGSIRASTGAVAKAMPVLVDATRKASENSVEASQQSAGAARQAREILVTVQGELTRPDGALANVRKITANLAAITDPLNGDVHKILASTDAALQPLREVLERIAHLADTLDEQVAQLSPKALATIDSLNQAITDLDRLIADPNIGLALAHVEGATGHADEALKSVDIALQPWRKRATQLKMLANVLLTGLKSFFRVTWAIH